MYSSDLSTIIVWLNCMPLYLVCDKAFIDVCWQPEHTILSLVDNLFVNCTDVTAIGSSQIRSRKQSFMSTGIVGFVINYGGGGGGGGMVKNRTSVLCS